MCHIIKHFTSLMPPYLVEVVPERNDEVAIVGKLYTYII
jgi:hypothetical protein